MKLSDHHSSKFVKAIYVGDSGTGKTGSLVSLVKAGYMLKILDYDNGLDSLKAQIRLQCPELMDNVDYITLSDGYKVVGQKVQVTPHAYIQTMKYLAKWDDDSDPSKGGEKEVLVLDSFTHLARAAFAWAVAQAPSVKDPRQWYGAAQAGLEHVLGELKSVTGEEGVTDGFDANVLVLTHINYKEIQKGAGEKGYPNAIGRALGPIIPSYFNTYIEAFQEASGLGSKREVKRFIRTAPTALLDLKNPVPFEMEAQYPLNEGLAQIFAKLKEN